MDEHQHHEELIKGISEEYSKILKDSEQGIYIYLDDNHKLCNQKLAEMLGYSMEEWAKPAEFIDTYVAKGSESALVASYRDSMQKAVGSSFEVVWKKKDDSELKTKVILVPISFQSHHFALHFISPV